MPRISKARQKLIEEGRRIEEQGEFALGTLTNQDGWPPRLGRPRKLTKREREKFDRETAKIERERKAAEAAERDERHRSIGEAFEEALKSQGYYLARDYPEWDGD